MRRAQDLAVSADPDSETWEQAADRAEEMVKLLDPFEAGRRCRSGQPRSEPAR